MVAGLVVAGAIDRKCVWSSALFTFPLLRLQLTYLGQHEIQGHILGIAADFGNEMMISNSMMRWPSCHHDLLDATPWMVPRDSVAPLMDSRQTNPNTIPINSLPYRANRMDSV